MNPGSAPYTGPSPGPQRELHLDTGGTDQSSLEVLPENLENYRGAGIPEPRTPQFQTSPTPGDQAGAVKASTSEARLGELIQALGRKQDEMDDKLEQQKLMYEAQLASMNTTAATPPANFDPNKPVTAGEMWQVLAGVEPYIKEQAIRSTWDITPEEEQSVLQANPHIGQIQNGAQKADFIRRAANLLRKSKGSNGEVRSSGSKAPSTDASGKAVNVRPISPGQRVVPHNEANTTPSAEDFSPGNSSDDARVAYEAAKKIPNKTERLTAMKAIFRQAQRGSGITDDNLAKSAFTSS